MRCLAKYALILIVVLPVAAHEPQDKAWTNRKAKPASTLYVFVTPADPGLKHLPGEIRRVAELLRRRGIRMHIRPVLLLSDFRTVRRLHRKRSFLSFIQNLQKLQDFHLELRLYDEEGLTLARTLSLTRTPAWAFVSRSTRSAQRHAHVAYGARAKVEEVISCRKR